MSIQSKCYYLVENYSHWQLKHRCESFTEILISKEWIWADKYVCVSGAWFCGQLWLQGIWEVSYPSAIESKLG